MWWETKHQIHACRRTKPRAAKMKLEESEALAAAAFAGAGTHARVREVVADLPASRSSTPRKEDGSVAATELRELGGGK
jgi:hypothetical protein